MDLQTVKKKKKLPEHQVHVTWEKTSGDLSHDGWVISPCEQHLGAVTRNAKWDITLKHWFDDEGKPLTTPVTSRITLESKEIGG